MDSAPTAAPTVDALADVVRAALGERYAHPVVRVDAELEQVSVPSGKALDWAREAVAAAFGDGAEVRIVEIDVSSLPWHAVPADGLRLWRQHGRADADGEVVTELEAGDPPVQVVTELDGWSLIRVVDGAQGWVHSDLLGAPASAAELTDGAIDSDAFVAAALAFEGVPYVWGGTTDGGVDCSGIVQRAAWRAGSVWLPRHSKALLGVGTRVAPSRVSRGDVLVLKRDPRTIDAERRAQQAALAEREAATGVVPAHGPAVHPMHVAIALSPTEALHASRDAMRVTREPLESLLARYRVLGVRRITTEEPS